MPASGPRYRRRVQDHDDHCTITFSGVNWRIRAMAGLGNIKLEALDYPHQRCGLDLSQADLAAYCNRARAWLEPDMAIDNV